MAKIALAVKYRPKTFDDVVEQDAIKDILQEQIRTETFQHAYLFCGPAGCGKTTAARIFANEINRGSGNPIEVDAASNNGVADVREIIDNAKRKSLDSEYKVYIIDECHMMSTGAWNAMLKLLEEPPKTTVFIMCTTDPQKIPATILSRVQRYDFSKISLQKIIERLCFILKEEEVPYKNNEEKAVEYIAKLAEGGMRDAITMLDKCLSLDPEITVESVVRTLGVVDYGVYFDLLFRLNTRGLKEAVGIVETVFNSGKDIKQFIKNFQHFVLDVCKYQMFESYEYVSIPELAEYTQAMMDEDPDDCLDVLDWVKDLNAEIKWESNAKAVIEAAIVLFIRGDKT